MIVVLFSLFCDVYLLGLLEKSMSQEGKNRVEISRVQTSLFQGNLQMQGFSLTRSDESVPQFQISSLEVSVDMPTLMTREWVVNRIELHQPVIRMEVDGTKLVSRALSWIDKKRTGLGAEPETTGTLNLENRTMKVSSIVMHDVSLLATLDGNENEIVIKKMALGPVVLSGKKREMLKMLQKTIVDALLQEANRQAPTLIRDGLKRNIVDKLKDVIDSDSLKEKSRAIKDKIKSFF
jgi:hypothetical protein